MVAPRFWSCLLIPALSFTFLSNLVAGYEVPVSDTDYDRQICSGMWGSQSTYINGQSPTPNSCKSRFPHLDKFVVTFDGKSQGQLAMVVYEWSDMAYLGKVTSTVNTDLPVSNGDRRSRCL